ncbi:hypothetical protein D3C79_1035920 [compost metagenome]
MAAVIAAMLKACDPKGAVRSDPNPVTIKIGLALVLNPSFRNTNMPGMYCPVKVIIKSGKATPNNACRENVGATKTGDAKASSIWLKSTRPILIK